MKKHPLPATLLLLLVTSMVVAQKSQEDFIITVPSHKVAGSFYNKLRFVDSRTDTTNYGWVQQGLLNAHAVVVTSIPLYEQLGDILDALIDSSAGDRALVFQLRNLAFAKGSGSFGGIGYCYLRANLYAENGEVLEKIALVDTVVEVRGMEVTSRLLAKAAGTFIGIIEKHLTHPPAGETGYSMASIAAIDNLEKSLLPLFTTARLNDGVYFNYHSLKNQVPDKQCQVKQDKKGIWKVMPIGKNGKPYEIDQWKIYAVVHEGKLHVYTKHGYYPVEMTGNELIFTGKASVPANTVDLITAGFFFGVVGVMMAQDIQAYFVTRIDHLNGGFIRLRPARREG